MTPTEHFRTQARRRLGPRPALVAWADTLMTLAYLADAETRGQGPDEKRRLRALSDRCAEESIRIAPSVQGLDGALAGFHRRHGR